MNLLWGIGGVIGVLAIAFLLSSNRKAINWRTILIALALQMSFSFIVLRWDAGKAGLKHAADGVQGLINFSYEGIKFVRRGFSQRKRTLGICILYSSTTSNRIY